MVDAVARLNPVSFGFEVTADFMHYKEGVYTRWAKDHEKHMYLCMCMYCLLY